MQSFHDYHFLKLPRDWDNFQSPHIIWGLFICLSNITCCNIRVMKEIIVVLQNIRSLHNVGSIFRTADAAGVAKIYLCGITPAPIDRFGKTRQQLTKVSLGAEKYLSWDASARSAQATLQLLDKLKSEGYKIFVIEKVKNSIPYYKINILTSNVNKLVLVVGNEVRGLTPGVLKRADKILEIPMLGKKESLNVGVAFGIVIYHLRFSE